VSRQFSSLRAGVDRNSSSFAELSSALRSLTTFPGLMAIATLIGFAFLALSLIFLLMLIF